MGSSIPLGECKEVMLDIESELQYWNRNYKRAAFHRSPCSFDQYLPTLKFGYDMYLLNRGQQRLDELLPVMRARYEASMDRYRSLEWSLAEAVIRETWKRMRPEVNHRANNRQMLVGSQPAGPSPDFFRLAH